MKKTVAAIALAVSSIAGMSLVAGISPLASAEPLGVIEKGLRARVPVFDESGKEIGRIDGKMVRNLAVTGYNDDGYLRAEVDGKVYYFRRADVKFNGPATCKLSPETRRSATRMAAGTPGMAAGAGSSGRACIPVKK